MARCFNKKTIAVQDACVGDVEREAVVKKREGNTFEGGLGGHQGRDEEPSNHPHALALHSHARLGSPPRSAGPQFKPFFDCPWPNAKCQMPAAAGTKIR
jgi:hypothetical protein